MSVDEDDDGDMDDVGTSHDDDDFFDHEPTKMDKIEVSVLFIF